MIRRNKIIKVLSLLLAVFMMGTVFVGCSPQEEQVAEADTGESSEDAVAADDDKEVEEVTAEEVEEEDYTFKLTMLGTGSPVLNEDNMGAGTLLEYGDNKYLVDCGYGVVLNLYKAKVNLGEVTNVFFTHLHTDHYVDYLQLLVRGKQTNYNRQELNVFGPTGTTNLHDTLIELNKEDLDYRVSALGKDNNGIRDNVEIKELVGENSFEFKGLKVSTTNVPHTIETLAYRFEADGVSIVFSGDLIYSEDFIELAKDADVAIMDGMLSSGKFTDGKSEKFMASFAESHGTLEDIVTMAAKANVKTLILNHFPPGVDEEDTLRRVKEIFHGQVILGADLESYTF
jgi:ribonuclease Z